MPEELEPPPSWPCFADEVSAVMDRHPEYDLEDAIEALIWGYDDKEQDDERD